ncbi:glycoside hydrolase domain-containing protein [Lentzea sp. HUAS TT2]|uniref:glycoside hydrolase domain-containing protein n=1 Tax=Lentzea sp. HUAS TT2 TaxID=3447454 RepID=UPI003F6F21C0
MDPRVLEAQKWVNATYGSRGGYERCPENGKTGWTTMYSLTRALQIELGIGTLSDSFGPTTLRLLGERGIIQFGYPHTNIVKILQHGLFCKGYNAGEVEGTYHPTTKYAVGELRRDIGLVIEGGVDPKLFKAILTMDAYVLLSGGRTAVRNIQQWLNNKYISRSSFFIIPCDGIYSRDVQTALLKAIQYEIGVPDENATGTFGPTTKAGLRNNPVRPGSSTTWVQLFSAACVFNSPFKYDLDEPQVDTVFKSAWDGNLTTWVQLFQRFSLLPQSGIGDFATWAQLLVSTGDADRPVSGCDTRFHILNGRAARLYDAGYRIVGRYLDEPPTSTLEKEIQPGELQAIFAGGLRVFPISQYDGSVIGNFTWSEGYDHALKAHDRAVGYGFNRGTVIYFAVDYDATGEEITSNIVPYFLGVQAGLANRGKRYIAGVYGSRNVCQRASNEAFARHSFVSGMSVAFSGNLGFPMPDNWSFTQIKEFEFSSGGDSFALDNTVFRGTEGGAGPENVGGRDSSLDDVLAYVDRLWNIAVAYGGDPNQRVLEYLRFPRYNGLISGWQSLIGDVDEAWINHARQAGAGQVPSYKDPSHGITINVDHLGATANAVYLKGSGTGTTGNRGDFGGWGGDLSTFYGEWRANAGSFASGYDFCTARLAKINVQSSFPLGDLVEDVDGHLLGTAARNGGRFNQLLRTHLTGNGHVTRFKRFFSERHGNNKANVVAAARHMIGRHDEDAVLDTLRWAAIQSTGGWPTTKPEDLPDNKITPFLQGYADTIQRLAGL